MTELYPVPVPSAGVESAPLTRAGLQKTSLIDFPGRVAGVVFLPGCNFSCPYCHNPDLVVDVDLSALTAWTDILAYLERRRGLLTGVVFSGGEPTLHEELPVLAAQVRALGYAVKLDTNGSHPGCIAAVGADFISLDIKAAPARYGIVWPDAPDDTALRIVQSMEVVRGLGVPYEFRVTCAPGIFGTADARALQPLLEPCDEVLLQPYRPGRVLDSGWAAAAGCYTEGDLDELLSILREVAPLARIRGR